MHSPKWIRNFGLAEAPFANDLEDADLWLPESRKAWPTGEGTPMA